MNATEYQHQLAQKLTQLGEDFQALPLPEPEVFPSPPKHFRMRAEFRIWHQEGAAHYAMNRPGEKQPYCLAPNEDGEFFPIAARRINQLMPLLLAAINQQPLLSKRLFAVEFLTGLSNEAIITLIYHRKLDEPWRQPAESLSRSLQASIIGRSRKQKVVVGQDFITETLNVAGHTYHYQQVETGFTQPNAQINQQMLGWAQQCSANNGGDLLELYCGNGNFTCVLAQNFTRVLATEVAKVSVKSAHHNLELNGINNVELVRLSSEELTQALTKVRPFRRLAAIDLDSYRFSTVFVDPPRAGLDADTVKLISGFDNILYISCNPQTLKNNLEVLTRTHRIQRFAVFDQFPYTPHLECGVSLSRSGFYEF